MAQLRQVDDREPLRHRARADRQPPRLLRALLPAGQRRAHRDGEVRAGEGPRTGDEIPRLDPEAVAAAECHLHRRAGPRRRADGDPAPRRQGWCGDGGLPHACLGPCRLGPALDARKHPHGRQDRAAREEPRRARHRHQRQCLCRRLPRSRAVLLHGPADRGEARRDGEGASGDRRQGRGNAVYCRGARSGEGPDEARLRQRDRQCRLDGPGALLGRGPRRLAAVVPPA